MASSATIPMKPLSWDKQLGLASPLPYAAIQSGKNQNPPHEGDGLDASHHIQVFSEGAEENFFLTSSFIGWVKWGCFNNYARGKLCPMDTWTYGLLIGVGSVFAVLYLRERRRSGTIQALAIRAGFNYLG